MRIDRIPFQRTAPASAALLATLIFSSAASAQASASAPSTPASGAAQRAADDDVVGLQTVVVTADRRSENIKRVPSSITAISGDDLEKTGAARIDDFVNLVPGLNFVGTRPGDRQLTLRGISSGGDQQSATVATYIDDVPVGSSNSNGLGARNKPDLDAFDLERIEVLRGPQGTLYGANSLGGLLKYVTVQPDPGSFQGFGRVEAMSASGGGTGFGANVGFNAPLSSTSAIRVTAFDRKEPGYIDNVNPAIGRKNVNDLHSSGARISYAAKPIAGLDIRLSAMTQEFKAGGESTEDISLPGGQPVIGNGKQNRYTPENSNQRFSLYSLSMDLDVAGGKLLSVTSYNQTRATRAIDWTAVDGMGAVDPSVPLAHEVIGPSTKKFTQELRYTSPRSDVLEWMTGVFWTRERSTLPDLEVGWTDQGVIAPAPNDNIFSYDLLSKFTEKAVYGNVRYYFSKSFDVAAGLRYTSDESQNHTMQGGLFGSGETLDIHQSEHFTSFMLSPRYLIDKQTTAYGRVASASRPGGVNGLPPSAVAAGGQDTFGPDKLTSYELGLKTSTVDGRFGLDLALFYVDWKDIQLRTTVNDNSFISNGGKAKSSGLEATLSARPIEGLNLGMNAAWTTARLTVDAPGVGGVAGERLPNSAKLTAGFTADYEFGEMSGGRPYVGGALRHVGDRLENFVIGHQRPRITAPAYDTLDLRAGMRWQAWDLNFYVKNATNERVVETVTTNFTPASATIDRPRTIGMFLTYRSF